MKVPLRNTILCASLLIGTCLTIADAAKIGFLRSDTGRDLKKKTAEAVVAPVQAPADVVLFGGSGGEGVSAAKKSDINLALTSICLFMIHLV